jgi:hypothetical protein
MADLESMSESVDGSREVQLVTTRLVEELEQPQNQGEIWSAVESEFKKFDDVPIREFVPVFVERRLRADLRARASAVVTA